jgi:hypothetical protein
MRAAIPPHRNRTADLRNTIVIAHTCSSAHTAAAVQAKRTASDSVNVPATSGLRSFLRSGSSGL